jgi:nucleoside-diphosphate-sugar epimerase
MVFLTGAAGFIGAKVARRLAARSLGVRGLALSDEPVGALAGLPVEVVRGDVTDLDSFAAHGSGVDTVVHCAAAMPPDRSERILRVNVDGTANVLRFAQRHGARRFVYVSAVSAVYRDKNVYGRSKAEAERLVAASGLDFTILRPTMVYGIDGGLHFRKLVGLIERAPGVLPVLGSGKSLLQPVWAEDAAGAIVLALTEPAAIGKTYNVSGATVVTFDQFVDHIAAVLKVRRRKVHIPLRLCALGARIAAPLLGPSFFSPEAIRGINEDAAIDYGPFRDECGYDPVSLQTGLARALAPRS